MQDAAAGALTSELDAAAAVWGPPLVQDAPLIRMVQPNHPNHPNHQAPPQPDMLLPNLLPRLGPGPGAQQRSQVGMGAATVVRWDGRAYSAVRHLDTPSSPD